MPILLDELVICLQEVLIVYPASAQGVHNVFVICSSYRGEKGKGVVNCGLLCGLQVLLNNIRVSLDTSTQSSSE